MIRIKLPMMFLVVVTLLATAILHADSDRQVRPKATLEMAERSAGDHPNAVPSTSRQGFVMVADVLDGFGGESESDNYRIPVNSGGQPSAVGLSESTNWGMEAGYVLAVRITRGDVNADGIINVGDVVYLVSYLYKGGPEPCPVESGDVTLDRIVNVGDVVYLVTYLYKGGPPPAC